MDILKLSAFSNGERGGNPAGVAILDALPDERTMQRVAAEVGFSETVFAAPQGGEWRVRYFSPEAEVPFCGHATIALGAALAMQRGGGVFPLVLNHAAVTVEGRTDGGAISASLVSPSTHSRPATGAEIASVLALFGFAERDIDPVVPPALVFGGNNHFALTLASRERLARMDYDLEQGRALMHRENWITIMLAHAEAPDLYHSRNAFAYGGVLEDPATGSATAAYAGYLRDLGKLPAGGVRFLQGEDMGMPSSLHAEAAGEPVGSIKVTGQARVMA